MEDDAMANHNNQPGVSCCGFPILQPLSMKGSFLVSKIKKRMVLAHDGLQLDLTIAILVAPITLHAR